MPRQELRGLKFLKMKKYILDLTVKESRRVHERYVLLRLVDELKPLPEMLPGQFAEVRVDGSTTTFLRRPISICNVDAKQNELWLLVAVVGDGTRWMATLKPGDKLNGVLPLGNGFTLPYPAKGDSAKGDLQSVQGDLQSPLLIGGGVGVAPLLYLGAQLKQNGIEPTFLLGARRDTDLLLLDEFSKYGRVLVTTEDGSAGEKGFVTQHSVLAEEHFDSIMTCGPTPMMKAVARYAHEKNIYCEASLENLMACGLGACLCCVEKTKKGNLCVCKDGPVFNTEELLWLD